MNYKELIYKAALDSIEEIYNESKYNKDVDLYRSYDIINAVNSAQVQSKEWLVNKLKPFLNEEHLPDGLRDVIVMGAWYGITGLLLREYIDHDVNIWNIDSDPMCEVYGKKLQQNIPSCEYNLFHTEDALEYYFDRYDAYQLIINTSCEHMDNEDLNLMLSMKPAKTLVCLQSNNFHKEPEHINTHNSLEEFIKSLNLVRVFWAGTLKPSDEYERYMVIGV